MSVARPFLPATAAKLDDEQLLDRLGAYWEALGVSDPAQASQLAARSLQRLRAASWLAWRSEERRVGKEC